MTWPVSRGVSAPRPSGTRKKLKEGTPIVRARFAAAAATRRSPVRPVSLTLAQAQKQYACGRPTGVQQHLLVLLAAEVAGSVHSPQGSAALAVECRQ